jgi:hypothetical protein
MASSPASGASPRTELALVVAGSGAAEAGGESGSLGAARAARKLAESEVRALENRILLLKKEEDKALLRISQTKKRAEEVLRLREENLARKKELAQHRLESSVAPADPEVVRRRFVEKELAKAARRKQVKAQYECKRAGASEFRSEKKRFEEDLLEQRQRLREEARAKKEAIRSEREEALTRAQLDRERAREQARVDYLRKVESEQEAARAFEAKAKRLARLERELLGSLEHTHDVQHRAFTELEATLKKTKLLAIHDMDRHEAAER